MPLRASCTAAAIAALLSAHSAAGQEPHLDMALQAALSRYSGRALDRVCARGGRCLGDSLAAQAGVRVAEGFDAVLAFRRTWADNQSRILEPSAAVAWWPSEGIFSTRVHAGVGLVVAPGTVGFDVRLGGELLVFPVNFFGLGLSGEIAPVGFLGGSSLKSSHVGAAIHLRL